jgi:hypothetical protein
MRSPTASTFFYHEAPGDRRPRRTLRSHDCQRASRKRSVHAVALCELCPPLTAQALRAKPAAYARKPRRTLHSHDYRRASRTLSVHAVALCSPCAYHVPYYTAQALRARGKRAVALPHAFRLPAIVAGWTWCAASTASAAAASTAMAKKNSPAAFHTAGVDPPERTYPR